eukprot:181042_1
MTDPVILIGDYQTYDKSNLEEWISTHGNVSPMNQKKLETTEFIPNLAIKTQLDQYNEKRHKKRQHTFESSFCSVAPNMNSSNAIQLLLVGDCNVGKTSIKKFIEFNEADPALIQPTIGIESSYLQFKEASRKQDVIVRVTDICGQDRFRSLTRQCYRNIHGVVLIASLDCKESVKNLESKWMEAVYENAPDNVYGIVVVNKCDLLHCSSEEDVVFTEKRNEYETLMKAAVQFANVVGFPIYNTSTVTGQYIHTAFADIVSRIMNDNMMWDMIQHNPMRKANIRLMNNLYDTNTCRDNGCMWALKGVGELADRALKQIKSKFET